MATKTSDIVIMMRVRGGRSAQSEMRKTRKEAEALGIRGASAMGAFALKADKFKDFGGKMTKGVTLPIVAAGAAATKLAMDFEKQVDTFEAVSGAGAATMRMIRKQALDAGAETAFSAKEAALAQTELAKGGLSAATILRGGLSGALSLAAAGELELGEAAEITANALNLFGLDGKQAGSVADALATAANATTADVSDFGMALKQSGGVAKSAGLSFNETMTALEALAASGVKNSDAGTSLKTALIQLIKPTDKQAKLAKKLGLSFIDAHGNVKSLSDISSMMRDKLGGMTKAQRTATLATLAGTDGVRTLTSLYDAGPKRLDKWSKGLQKSGSAAETAKKKQENLAGKMEQLKGSLETLGIIVGTTLIPVLSDIAKTATPIVNDLASAFQGLPPGMQQALVGVLLFSAAVGPASFVVGLLAGGVGRLLKVLIWMRKLTILATAAQWLFNFALMANPIGLVIAAIVALVALFVLAYLKIKPFRDVVNAIFGFIKRNWRWLILPLAPIIGPIVIIVSQFRRIRSAAVAAFNWVKNAASDFVNFWSLLPGRMWGVMRGMFDGIKGAFRSAINWVLGKWNALEFKTPKVDLGPLGSFGGFTVGVPDIGLLAQGGYMTGYGSAIVGDGGVPEVLTLSPHGAAVQPLSAAPAGALAGGGNRVVHEHRFFIGGREVTDAVGHEVRVKKAQK